METRVVIDNDVGRFIYSTTYYTDVFQSGSSFSGRRRSRSPSPVGIGVRSRSMDGRMPKITVDRWESSQMLALKYKSKQYL